MNNLTIKELNIIPNQILLDDLYKDYKFTKDMFLDNNVPEFEQIINELRRLQKQITNRKN